MLSFELKKIVRNRLLLFLLVLLMAVNLSQIVSDFQMQYGEHDRLFEGKQSVYDAVEGSWDLATIEQVVTTKQKLDQLISGGDYSTEHNQSDTITGYLFSDAMLYEEVEAQMKSLYHYERTMTEHTQMTQENVAFYQSNDNAYQVNRNRLMADTYVGRSVSGYYAMEGMERYLQYDFSTLLILLLVLPLLSPIFAKEREIEMDGLLRLTQNYE